ncbi:MAG: GspH/FimT family pseudopilin [Planctomycetota bacterium]
MLRRRAYTLVELAIVVLVLGILAGVAAPKYVDSLAYFRVEAAAKRIAADMQYARRQAIQTATAQPIAFDTLLDEYTLTNSADIDHAGVVYVVHLEDEGYPADITAADFGGDANVSFDHEGVADSAGSVTVMSGGHARTVTIALPHTIAITP